MDLSDEGQLGLLSFEYLLSAFIGVMILAFVVYHQWHDKKVQAVQFHNSEDFTQCQSSNCVRCQQKYYEHNWIQWTERLDRYMEMQTSEMKDLMELKESFKRNGQVKATQGGNAVESDMKLQKPSLFFYEKLKTPPWCSVENELNMSLMQDVQSLRDKFRVIREEFDRVYTEYKAGNEVGWTVNNVPSGSWLVFHLFNQGAKVTENCRRCPWTVGCLTTLDNFMSGVLFGYCCFSVLQPGSHIIPHYGPCNVVQTKRGLYVPENCSLTVACETRQWEEGECLLFDDSYLHQAKVASQRVGSVPRPRVILMVDLWHPDLGHVEREALKKVFAAQ